MFVSVFTQEEDKEIKAPETAEEKVSPPEELVRQLQRTVDGHITLCTNLANGKPTIVIFTLRRNISRIKKLLQLFPSIHAVLIDEPVPPVTQLDVPYKIPNAAEAKEVKKLLRDQVCSSDLYI